MNKILNVICGDFVLGMPVLEAVVSGDRLQVVRVSADGLRSGLRIVFPPCCDVNVKNRKQPHINYCCHFQRLDDASRPLAEVQ